jgi:hypothetical protein
MSRCSSVTFENPQKVMSADDEVLRLVERRHVHLERHAEPAAPLPSAEVDVRGDGDSLTSSSDPLAAGRRSSR